jgi:hypothetical protein
MASLNRRRWSAVSSPMATRSSAARLWPGVPPGGRGGAAAGRRMPRQGRWRSCRRFPGRPRHAGGPRCRSPADPPPAPTSGPGRRSGRSRVPWGRCGPDALRADGPGTRLPAGAAPPRPGAPGTGGRRPPTETRRSGCSACSWPCSCRKSKKVAASSRASSSGCSTQSMNRSCQAASGTRQVGLVAITSPGQWERPQRSRVAGGASGQGREPGVGSRRGVVGHHQGMVLVGAQRAFLAGAAAQHQQRIRAWWRPRAASASRAAPT